MFNVFPKFICFPLTNVGKYDVYTIRRRLLKTAINNRLKEKRKFVYDMEKIEKKIKQVLSGIEYFIFYKALCRNIDREVHNIVKTHQKKLKTLTKNCVLPLDSKDIVTNISSYTLTQDESKALKFGLSHSIVPPYINKTDIFASFESIFNAMISRLLNKKDENKLKTDLSHLAHLYVNSFELSPKDIKIHKVLENLHKNNEIVVLKPDKGNGVVILNRSDYTESILNIINDTHKFKELYSDPTIIREGKLQRFLRDLKKNDKIDKEIYSTIYPSGSQPARIYGLPKMHKIQSPNAVPPFRPIVSSVNTFNYQLPKCLCNLLQSHLPNTCSVSDTFSFVQELETVDFSNKFMVSFDVVS